MTGANLLELDSIPPLGELLDIEALEQLCSSFLALHGVGLQLFDQQGERLLDASPHARLLEESVTSDPIGVRGLGETNLQIERAPLGSTGLRFIQCFSGARYLAKALLFEGEALGRIALGPYFVAEAANFASSLRELEGVDEERLEEVQQRIPILDDVRAHKILEHAASLFDALILAASKVHFTSKMHLETLWESHREMSAKTEALQKSYEQLQQLDRLKSSFLATVSHELRTPLTSIIGYAEILAAGRAGEVSEGQREHLETIIEKGEGLLGLVDSLLDLNRIESGRLAIEATPSRIEEILEGAISSVRPQLEARELAFEVQIQGELGDLVVDREILHRCLVNLLGNAVKFTPPGGKITVEVGPAPRLPSKPQGRFDGVERYFSLRVVDTGLGIPAEHHERIFDSFYQVDGSSTRAYGGSGLGLAIVRHCVEALGGEVRVQSAPGEGSTFQLILPRVYMPPRPGSD